MGEFRWTLLNHHGAKLRTSDPFETRAEAEQWMASEWSSLAGEGATSVVLMEDGTDLYQMSLEEE